MRIEKQGHLYQLTFLPTLFPVNCYLVEEEKELTLIDAAFPFSWRGILQTAQEIGKPITRILITHAHDDHTGALDHLKKWLPDAAVYISERDARVMSGDRSLEPGEPPSRIRGGVSKGLQTRPDYLLRDGDTIGSLQAVLTSGHTPGHMAFWDGRENSVIAGDAFQTRGGIAVGGKVNLLFPFPAFMTWNLEVALKSAQLLRDLNPSVLAVGHGKMMNKPVQEMSRAIFQAEQLLERRNTYAPRT